MSDAGEERAGDGEEEEEDEEEEEVEYVAVDTGGMPDGPVTVLLGGCSGILDTAESLGKAKENSQPRTILVYEGTYGPLEVGTEESGIQVVGCGEVEKVRFASCSVEAATCSIEGVSIASKVVIKSVTAKPAAKPVFTGCRVDGGVDVHPGSRPMFIGCWLSGPRCALYCFPTSCAEIRPGTPLVEPAALRPAPASPTVCSLTLSIGTLVTLLQHPISDAKQDEEGVPWVLVKWGSVQGWVARKCIGYASPVPTEFAGDAGCGSVGVYVDDAACFISSARIVRQETGVYMKGRCKGCRIEDTVIDEISGIGLYFDSGCRAAVRRCRVRTCAHYAALVSAGPAGGTDEVSQLCEQMEAAEASGNNPLHKTLLESLQQRGILLDRGTYTWTDPGSRSTGRWKPPETSPVLRDNIFKSSVRLDNGTSPSFFGNVIVKPSTLVVRSPFAVSGVEQVREEPKIPELKREEDEEA